MTWIRLWGLGHSSVVVSTVARNCHFLPGEVEVARIGGHVDAQQGREWFGLLVHNLFGFLLLNHAIHVG